MLTLTPVADTPTRLPNHRPDMGPILKSPGATQTESGRPGRDRTPPLGMAATCHPMGVVPVHSKRLEHRDHAETVEHVASHPPIQKGLPHLSTELSAHIRLRLHVHPLCLTAATSHGTAPQSSVIARAGGSTQRPHHQRTGTEPLVHTAPK